MVEPPNECDRPLPFVPHIPRRPQTPERPIIGLQSREEHDVRSALKMPDVPLPDLAIGCRR